MTDLEMTKLCAEAMSLTLHSEQFIGGGDNSLRVRETVAAEPWQDNYWPLHDDAQAMALVKRFQLHIFFTVPEGWNVGKLNEGWKQPPTLDLNRAICWCVAKMQAAHAPA